MPFQAPRRRQSGRFVPIKASGRKEASLGQIDGLSATTQFVAWCAGAKHMLQCAGGERGADGDAGGCSMGYHGVVSGGWGRSSLHVAISNSN